MTDLFQRLSKLYDRHILTEGREPQLLVLVAFLSTFVIVRPGTNLMKSGRKIPVVGRVVVKGTHVHHLVPGIILLLVSGYLGVAIDRSRLDYVAIAFGIGAALTLDEFALWLNLRDVYWEREGRRSIDAVIAASAILAIFVIGGHFFYASASI